MSDLLPVNSAGEPKFKRSSKVSNNSVLQDPSQAKTPLPNIALWRFVLAFLIAVVADIILAIATPFEAIELPLDILTALLLCLTVGFNWIFLPSLLVEAVPGLEVFPTWTLVVLALGGIKFARKKR